MQSTDSRDLIQRLTQAFGNLPQVLAVVLAGSRAAATSDLGSDFDLYVYAVHEVPVEFRRTLLGEGAEIDNRFWETGDEWRDPSTGTQIDIMYRSPAWIEGQLDRVLSRHEATLGYTTCFWYNVVHSEAQFDPRGCPYHSWAVAVMKQVSSPMLTTEHRQPGTLGGVEKGTISAQIEFSVPAAGFMTEQA